MSDLLSWAVSWAAMLSGAGPERLVVLEMGGHGSFVRPPELCLPVFGRFVTGRE